MFGAHMSDVAVPPGNRTSGGAPAGPPMRTNGLTIRRGNRSFFRGDRPLLGCQRIAIRQTQISRCHGSVWVIFCEGVHRFLPGIPEPLAPAPIRGASPIRGGSTETPRTERNKDRPGTSRRRIQPASKLPHSRAAAVRHESFRHQSEQTGSPVLRATNIAPGYAVMFAVPIPDRAKPTGSAALLTEAAS